MAGTLVKRACSSLEGAFSSWLAAVWMMNGPFQKIGLPQTGLLQCGSPGQFTLKPLAEVRVAEFKIGLLRQIWIVHGVGAGKWWWACCGRCWCVIYLLSRWQRQELEGTNLNSHGVKYVWVLECGPWVHKIWLHNCDSDLRLFCPQLLGLRNLHLWAGNR